MIRVLVADDHEVLRWGLIQVLDSQPDITVVGEVSTGRAAVSASSELSPDVLLLDLSMPGGDGWTALEGVLGSRPDARVVILSAADDVRTVDTALRRGASAHVSKAAGSDHLLQVLRDVADDGGDERATG